MTDRDSMEYLNVWPNFIFGTGASSGFYLFKTLQNLDIVKAYSSPGRANGK